MTPIPVMDWQMMRDLALLAPHIKPTTGNIFFVHATLGNTGESAGMSSRVPITTLQAAINKCNSNVGDNIVLMPGHTETVSVASGITVNKIGISIIGLGNEDNRPVITFAGVVGASMVVSAANVYISNVVFSGGVDALTGPISVQAAGFEMSNWKWVDTVGQATDVVLTTAAANNMHLHNFIYDGAAAAGTNAGIAIVGGDGIRVHDFIADGNFAVGCIDVRTTATTDLKVYNVWSFRTRNAADIFLVDTITGSTGTVGPNLNLRLNDNAANITEACTGATFVYFPPINIVNLAGELSMSDNKTASTDA